MSAFTQEASPFVKRRKLLLSFKNLRDRQKSGESRIDELLDKGSFKELFAGIHTSDPLNFPGYKEKAEELKKVTGAEDAFKCGRGSVGGIEILCGELSGSFLMGSMGSVVGEKIVRLAGLANEERKPLVIFSASGGARMQEGMFSLMQMSRTAAAVQRFKDNGGLFISVLTDPCMGGVSASFASLGDICLAEPEALIGFAGPRVIEQTIRKKLPEGFQRAEFQLEHGFVDRIAKRSEMPELIRRLIALHECGIANVRATTQDRPCGGTVKQAESKASVEQTKHVTQCHFEEAPRGSESLTKTAWERVQAARDKDRPKTPEIIEKVFDEFTELSGDRCGKDDRAIIGGVAYLKGMPVTVMGQRKGRNASENLEYNFGMPGPAGYRKALRLMRQAEKFNRPVVTFIDTPGAYPGTEAEENGISIAIAENLAKMSCLKVPVIAVVTGEGNSGGALALGVADRVWMLENAVYSILSPEGFASILWKDAGRAVEAAGLMRLTAEALLEDGFADEIIAEPEEGLREGLDEFCEMLKCRLHREIFSLMQINREELAQSRYERIVENGIYK